MRCSIIILINIIMSGEIRGVMPENKNQNLSDGGAKKPLEKGNESGLFVVDEEKKLEKVLDDPDFSPWDDHWPEDD